ncbi:MAG: aminopeptidase P family N-terminal domain-containing protein [Dehalococcoidia bacterium]
MGWRGSAGDAGRRPSRCCARNEENSDVGALRLDRLRATFEEHTIDALLVTEPHNRRYLSGFTGSAGSLLIGRDAAVVAADFRYWEQATAQKTPRSSSTGWSAIPRTGSHRWWRPTAAAGSRSRRTPDG